MQYLILICTVRERLCLFFFFSELVPYQHKPKTPMTYTGREDNSLTFKITSILIQDNNERSVMKNINYSFKKGFIV